MEISSLCAYIGREWYRWTREREGGVKCGVIGKWDDLAALWDVSRQPRGKTSNHIMKSRLQTDVSALYACFSPVA